MTRRPLALLLVASATLATAASRDEYGYGWTLSMTPGKGAYRLDLTESVYARIADPGLRDLEVFNGQGQSVPFGPVPREAGVPAPTATVARAPVPWFAVPGAAVAQDGGVSLHVVRDADGTLRALDAEVRDAAPDARHDYVLDLSAIDDPVDELELSWPDGRQVSARFRVTGSSDFEHWSVLAPQATLLDMAQGEFRLRRTRVDLAGSVPDYVRLERLDDGEPVPLEAVVALLSPPPPAPGAATQPSTSSARHERTTTAPVAYEYAAAGPMPIERVSVELATPNSVSRLAVWSRDDAAQPWRYHGDVTAFRIEAGGARIEHDDLVVNTVRDRQWRLVPNPPLDAPPALAFGFRPEAFVLLEQGSGPYTLAAGSAGARRAEYPMAVLLGALRAQLGRDWSIERASVGDEVQMRGAAALVPPPPPKPVKVWALWAVLVAGAFAVVFMVFRLLGARPADGDRTAP